MNIKEFSSRKTKVIWSFEADVLNEKVIEQIEANEFDALRLVYSASSPKSITKFLEQLRKRESKGVEHIPIMLDVATLPRAHVKNLENPVDLAYGDIVEFVNNDTATNKKKIAINTNVWEDLFKEEAKVYFGFGNVIFRIESIDNKEIKAKTIQGGTIFPHMDIHIPETRKPHSVKKLADIDLAAFSDFNIDYVVLPGINSAREISIIKKKIQANSKHMPWIITKIDSKSVYDNMEEVIDAVDGLMISRRELALSIEPATIPMITKEIIQLANQKAKLVITASEILGSMRHNPTPTRAEVSDIANCVMDGTDAVLISEEISYGTHMDKALEVCKNVIIDIESNKELEMNWLKEIPKINNEFDAVSFQAYKTAKRLNAKAIVCITKEGNTAMKLASFRQDKPIIAVTFKENVNKRLSLTRGVEGVVLDENLSLDEIFPAVNDLLKRRSWLSSGDTILFVSVTISSMSKKGSNLMTIQQVV